MRIKPSVGRALFGRGAHVEHLAFIVIAISGGLGGCARQATAQAVDGPLPVYEVVVGSGMPVCDAYRFVKTTRTNGVQVERPPFGVPDFGAARYRGAESGVLLRRVRDFLWVRDINPVNWLPQTEAPQWTGTTEQRERAQRSFFARFEADMSTPGGGFRISHFDIDNDRDTDPIFYRVGSGGSTLLVLTADEMDIDLEKSEKVLQHPSRLEAHWPELRPPSDDEVVRSPQKLYPVSDAYRSAEYGVFNFEGLTYLDHWWQRHPEYPAAGTWTRGSVHVYLIENDRSREVCVMRLSEP